MGVAWDPASKSVYVMQHGRDQLAQLWPEYFDEAYSAENPAEEFLRLATARTSCGPTATTT